MSYYIYRDWNEKKFSSHAQSNLNNFSEGNLFRINFLESSIHAWKAHGVNGQKGRKDVKFK